MNKKLIGSLAFLITFFSADAQDRYAVYFKFKPHSSLSLSQPQEFLTQKAIDRRIKEGIQVDSLDLPVSAKYLDEVTALADDVLYSSRWMNAAVLVVDQSGADLIATLPFVSKVDLVAPGFLSKPESRIRHEGNDMAGTDNSRDKSKLNTRELATAASSYDFQNQLIGINEMHEEGYTGDGVLIAVFDAGFPGTNTASAFAHLFTNNQIIAQRDIVRPWNTDVFTGHQHGTNVLSLIAANEPEKLVSGAFDADFILAITEEVETEYRVEEFNWVSAAEYADSLGVDIISSSVGYWDFDDPAMNYTIEDLDGETAIITKGAAVASQKGILVVNSVGNYGSRGMSSLVAPADAEGVIAVGSVKTDGEISSFSSRGPTGDGRLKPDLAAFGDNPVLIRANGSVGSSNGTSFSAPQIAALAAGLWQAKPGWTKTELLENLFRSATQYDSPDSMLGYGVPNFFDALYGEILTVEKQESNEWKIYPNPLMGDELFIRFGTKLSGTLELLDVSGKTLVQSELTRSSLKDPYRVELTGIKSGLYLIMLRDEATIIHSKLIKK